MLCVDIEMCFFFSSRRRHTRWTGDWSSDVCSSDLDPLQSPCKTLQLYQSLFRNQALSPEYDSVLPYTILLYKCGSSAAKFLLIRFAQAGEYSGRCSHTLPWYRAHHL